MGRGCSAWSVEQVHHGLYEATCNRNVFKSPFIDIGKTKSDRQNHNFEKKEWFRSARSFLGWWSCVTTMKKRWLPTSRLCLFQTFDTSEADSGHTCQHVIWFFSEKGYVVLHPLIDIISRIVQLLALTFHFTSFFCKQTKPQKASLEKTWVFPTARGFCLGLCLSICVEFVEFRT